jgi:hypothetical protein
MFATMHHIEKERIMPVNEQEVITVTIQLEFDMYLLKKMKRLDLVNSVQMEVDSAVAEVLKELDECLGRDN